MRVLIGCEFSGVVRRAFRERGHDAWSCDLLPAEDGSPYHHTGYVEPVAYWGCWDLMIAHPPCTHLAVSGARWFKEKREEQKEALALVRYLMNVPIPRICLENPISIISSHIRKPEQIVQPWMFGHKEFKATCLWLKNLPKLQRTSDLVPPKKGTPEYKQWSKVHYCPPGPDRWKIRSRTYTGLAEAMAEQWGQVARKDFQL